MIHSYPTGMNSPENKARRVQYVQTLMEHRHQRRNIVYIDETNFNLFIKRKFGRSKIGSRCAIVEPNNRGKNLHCIGAIYSEGLIDFRTRRGSLKKQDFIQYLENLHDICRERELLPVTFVIDNAPAHQQCEQNFQRDDCIILRLAPYSFLINPIKKVWSAFKSEVKRLMSAERPAIINYIRQPGGLTIEEFRMRKQEEAANQARRSMSDLIISRSCLNVERYYITILNNEDLIE